MGLSKKEVEHIAFLARLGLSEAEVEKFSQQLSSILDYVKKLQEVDTSQVKPIAQITGLENVMRQDEIKEVGKEAKEELLKLAPETENNLIKTKSVFG